MAAIVCAGASTRSTPNPWQWHFDAALPQSTHASTRDQAIPLARQQVKCQIEAHHRAHARRWNKRVCCAQHQTRFAGQQSARLRQRIILIEDWRVNAQYLWRVL